MKRSLSIIGLVFALVGMLAGTALAGPKYAFLCSPFEGEEDVCSGSALVFEFSHPPLASWAFEVEGLDDSTRYTLFNNTITTGDVCIGREIFNFRPVNGNAAGDRLIREGVVEDEVHVCVKDTPIQVLTGTLRKGGKPRRH